MDDQADWVRAFLAMLNVIQTVALAYMAQGANRRRREFSRREDDAPSSADDEPQA